MGLTSKYWLEQPKRRILSLPRGKSPKRSAQAVGKEIEAGIVLWHDPSRPMPGLQAVSTIAAEALKLNRDDEIFRTDGVYFRDTTPPFSAGSEAVLVNVFMDFNVKVISL